MKAYQTHRIHHGNGIHTILLFMAMSGLLGAMGWLLGGAAGLQFTIVLAGTTLLFSPRIPAHMLMRVHGAGRLQPHQLPELHHIVDTLARRAGLETPPALYYSPSMRLNAFAAGNRHDAAICITQGLLNLLNTREMAGILAHELTHIQHNDMEMMGLSGLMMRMIRFISLLGQLVLVLLFPLLFLGEIHINPWGIVLMIAAPTISVFIHLALSRAQEFEADDGSARLTSDPCWLASALKKLELLQRRRGPWQMMMAQVRPRTGLLSTHPPVSQRISRLLSHGTGSCNGSRISPSATPGLITFPHFPGGNPW